MHSTLKWIIGFSAPALLWAHGTALSALPQDFDDYRQALEAGQDLPYPALQLADHPGMPWLKMLWMRPRLGELDTEEVARFISRHRDRPFAVEFRHDWLLALGRAERWRDFSRHYRGERDQQLQCLALRAGLAAGQQPRVHRESAALWLTGRDLPADCDPLFDSAREADVISDFMHRERLRLALRRNNLSLAEQLATQLGDDRALGQIQRQRDIYRDPAGVLDALDSKEVASPAVDDYVKAIKRLARRDVRDAINRWQEAEASGLAASNRDRFLVTRRIALEAARDHLPEAEYWLEKSAAEDDFIRAWRIRNGLRLNDWEGVLAAIDGNPDDNSRQWRYWRARALEQTDSSEAAEGLYRALAASEDYYGLLAARRLSETPQRSQRPIEADPSRMQALSELPGIVMAKAMLDADWESAAQAEWRHALAEHGRADRCQAALLASEWEWPTESVITAARAGCRGDPRVDYPLAFADLVKHQTNDLNLDTSWAWSIMRAESLFATQARSHVGALGLMQLMPATAAHVADNLGLDLKGERDILRPENNIALGTAYLREMLDRFDGHPLVATAAYNAGPHRAQAWLPEDGHLDGDVWAEIIPFRETRRYIRRVMTHSLGFDQRLGQTGDTLGQRLGPVGRDALDGCLLAAAESESAVSC